MTSLDILRKIGLCDGEIKVYSALLNKGESTLNELHQAIGIERRNIYDILNKLIEKGLVSFVQENKHKVYKTSSPKKILSYIQEKQESLQTIEKDILHLMPTLEAKYDTKAPAITGEVFRGHEGIKTAWEDALNEKEMRFIGSGRYIPKQYPVWFARYNRERIRKKIVWYNLFRHEFRKEVTAMEFEHIKFLPKEFSGNPTYVLIWGNKVGNFISGETPFGFVIESKELAENYKQYHKYLWEQVAKD